MAGDARAETAGLVVVGASVGGLVAAILAADRGRRVVVLEREREPGGSARAESETVAAAGTRLQAAGGIADEAGAFAADLVAAARHHCEPELAHALARESGPLVDWLTDRCGVAFELTRHVAPGHSAPRLHAPEGGGAGLVAALARAASRQTRTSLRCGSTVESLVRDAEGAVTGVTARSGRRGGQVVSGPVVLACGGFAAADTLVAAHCPEAADLPYLGWPGATGEALRLGDGAAAPRCHGGDPAAQPSRRARRPGSPRRARGNPREPGRPALRRRDGRGARPRARRARPAGPRRLSALRRAHRRRGARGRSVLSPGRAPAHRATRDHPCGACAAVRARRRAPRADRRHLRREPRARR